MWDNGGGLVFLIEGGAMYETYSTRFDSNDVMAYILGVCEAKKIGWNLTKAQKILYCCYGVILAAFENASAEAYKK